MESNSSSFTVGDGGRSWRKVTSGESTSQPSDSDSRGGAKKGWRSNSTSGQRDGGNRSSWRSEDNDRRDSRRDDRDRRDDRRDDYRRDDRRDSDRRDRREEDRREERRDDRRDERPRKDTRLDRDEPREMPERRDGGRKQAAKTDARDSERDSAGAASKQNEPTGSLVDDNFRMAQMLKERLNPGGAAKVATISTEVRTTQRRTNNSNGSASNKVKPRRSPSSSPERDNGSHSMSEESAEERKGGKAAIHLPELASHARSNSYIAESGAKGSRLSKRRLDSHDAEGRRTKYYKDDDVSLDVLVKREKHGVDNYDKNYFENVAGNKRYKEPNEANDPDFADDLVDFLSYESKDKRMSKEKLETKQKARALSDYRTMVKKQSDCYYCFENHKVPKQLLISIGEQAQLVLPVRPLCPGHCIISPLEHHTSGCPSMERELWEEMRKFQQAVHKMNATLGFGTIFIESNIIGKHTYLECFRIPPGAAAESQAYFMKAITEAESEWSVNKKLVQTTPDRTIRHAIPVNFPYFHVQFGMSQGYAHVIEKELNFQDSFGHEVIAGLLGLEDRFTQGKIKRKSLESEEEDVKAFLTDWMPFDWTADLDGGTF